MKADFEPLLHRSDGFLLSRWIRLPSFDHPYHFHPEIEITYIARSAGTRVIGDHIGSFQPGELYLLGGNLPHVFRNTIKPKQGAEAEVLHFLPGPAPGFLEAMPETRAFAQLLDRSKAGLSFDQETSKQAGRLLGKIRRSNGAMRLAAFFELAGILAEAPSPLVLASASGSLSSRQTPGSERIHRICSTILTRFREDLCHAEMARLAALAPASFSRLFVRTTRKTFTQFLTEVRLDHACQLLREGDGTVADIAFESGFNNLSNFNRRFKQYMRITPQTYRHSLRSLVLSGNR